MGITEFTIIAIIVLGLFLLKYYKDNFTGSFPEINIESLTKEELLKWFKKDEILEQLKNNKNLMAIVVNTNHDIVKKIHVKNKHSLIQILFNEEKNYIIDAQILNSKNISSEVLDMFANKNMIVLG